MDGRKKGTLAKKKKTLNDETEDENILQDCLNSLEFLFRFRLIEKIARPVDKRVREEKIQEYGERMAELHEKLTKIKNEIVEMNYNDAHNPKKSVFGEVTSKPHDWRKTIRNIEAKYNEVPLSPLRSSSTAATSSSARSSPSSPSSTTPPAWSPSPSRTGLHSASILAPPTTVADPYLLPIQPPATPRFPPSHSFSSPPNVQHPYKQRPSEAQQFDQFLEVEHPCDGGLDGLALAQHENLRKGLRRQLFPS
jgi:hypothetical protein